MEKIKLIFIILTVLLVIGYFILITIKPRKHKLKKRIKRKVTLVFIIILVLNIIIIAMTNVCMTSKKTIIDDKIDKESSESMENIPNDNDLNENLNKTKKGFKIEQIDGVTYIDNQLIVNKTYLLPDDFIPKNTYKYADNTTGVCQLCINKEAYNSYTKMHNEMAKMGLNIWIQSGYRSYNYQVKLYNSYVKNRGKEAADTFSARPGASEHQSGLSFDLNTITDAFADTKEGKWINDNCYKYGFIIRFPKGKEDETGYKYESWHLRYVGKDLATKLYNNGDWRSLEEYYGIESKYLD